MTMSTVSRLISSFLATLALLANPLASVAADQNTPSPAPRQVVDNEADRNPVQVLHESIINIQHIIDQNSDEIKNNPHKLREIVNKYLIPNVAEKRVAAMLLGPKWRTATPQQRKKFINAFTTLLIHIYSKNVTQVGNYKVKLDPVSKDQWQGQSHITVHGRLVKASEQNSQGSSLDIYLVKEDQRWKIYDIAVEGISIMKNYRSQFDSIDTMEGVIKAVKKVNARSKN